MRIRENNFCGQVLLALLFTVANATATISLSNFYAGQIEGTKQVAINFDVSNSAASSVAVSVLISNGVSPVVTTTLSGHIGNSVPTGTNRQIIWDGGMDYPDNVTTNLSITLQVSDPAPVGMVRIPAGSNSGLTVDSFMMDATEITKSHWDLVANSTPDVSAGSGAVKAAGHPVQGITWYECVRWCNARSIQDGLTPCYNVTTWACDFSADGYRLPTRVECEYASRGGLSNQLYPWGNEIDHTNANYYSSVYDMPHPDYSTGGYPYTSPVGSFDPNGYGLYDMAGNVWEWCNDSSGGARIRKGGSWDSWETDLRCGSFVTKPPEFDSWLLGFRTVRNAPVPEMLLETIVFDSRNYTLTVASDYGSPIPAVGVSSYAWMSELTCEVDAGVVADGTNYTCTGWYGLGSVPASGPFNGVTVMLSNLNSSIIWNWASDDTDQDMMNDEWEIAFFGDLAELALDDFDLDGQNNLNEYISGTDPTNAASLFELSQSSIAGSFILEWPAASNRIYNVYWSDNLLFTGFLPIETNIFFPRNSATTTATALRGFYKVDVRK